MQRIVGSAEAREIDRITIDRIGIPSMVLMERASLAVARAVKAKADTLGTPRILVVCGCGNNGADGVAAARHLFQWGYDVDVRFGGEGTGEMSAQLSIARELGVRLGNNMTPKEYNIIVDGLFGVGLSRQVEGDYALLVDEINASGAYVIAIDVPSGINATDGRVMNVAVMADETITFGYVKLGLLLYPGAGYAGHVTVEDVGFYGGALDEAIQCGTGRYVFTHTQEDLSMIPHRRDYSNKGTFGKLLVVAGSRDMGGAVCLSSLAAYRTGAGMVKAFTHEDNRAPLLGMVPEALIDTYGDADVKETLMARLDGALEWSGHVLVGPGLSRGEQAVALVRGVLAYVSKGRGHAVFDADALNIAAAAGLDLGTASGRLVVTPHLGEMSRLVGKPVEHIRENLVDVAAGYAKDTGAVCVLKDARTVVASPDGSVYVNTSGNSGMATAGSGDVLGGVIAGLMCIGMEPMEAACMGVYLHGLGGDDAARVHGRHGMKAGDIIEGMTGIMASHGL